MTKKPKKPVEIDDVMAAARIEGDDDIYELCTMAETVRIEGDELGEEWILHFRVDDETYYAYIPLETELDEIIQFLVDQDIHPKFIKYSHD